jgi:hypothetical protein
LEAITAKYTVNRNDWHLPKLRTEGNSEAQELFSIKIHSRTTTLLCRDTKQEGEESDYYKLLETRQLQKM